MPELHDFKVLTFDCYGTLIDWETGIWDALQPLLMAGNEARVHRAQALAAFARAESETQAERPDTPYPGILYRVHQKMAGAFGLQTSDELNAGFADSVQQWPAFADTADALRVLKEHYRLVILSNVHRDGFSASNRKLGVEFDAVYTAQDIGSYKPSPANFEYLLDHLRSDFGLDRADILHTAQSLFHDHVVAKKFGLANAWIDRQRQSESGDRGATATVDEMPDIDFRFFSMAEMAEAVAGRPPA